MAAGACVRARVRGSGAHACTHTGPHVGCVQSVRGAQTLSAVAFAMQDFHARLTSSLALIDGPLAFTSDVVSKTAPAGEGVRRQPRRPVGGAAAAAGGDDDEEEASEAAPESASASESSGSEAPRAKGRRVSARGKKEKEKAPAKRRRGAAAPPARERRAVAGAKQRDERASSGRRAAAAVRPVYREPDDVRARVCAPCAGVSAVCWLRRKRN